MSTTPLSRILSVSGAVAAAVSVPASFIAKDLYCFRKMPLDGKIERLMSEKGLRFMVPYCRVERKSDTEVRWISKGQFGSGVAFPCAEIVETKVFIEGEKTKMLIEKNNFNDYSVERFSKTEKKDIATFMLQVFHQMNSRSLLSDMLGFKGYSHKLMEESALTRDVLDPRPFDDKPIKPTLYV